MNRRTFLTPWWKEPDIDLYRVESVLVSLGFERVKRAGRHVTALCPFHADHNPSFAVSANGHGRCFSCGHGGFLVQIVMDLLNESYRNAARFLDGY